MAGTLVIDTLKASSGVLATQNGMTGIAKAWVNYNGTAATITGSFNVGSVTKNTSGDYTINFATSMSNTAYSFCGSAGSGNGRYIFLYNGTFNTLDSSAGKTASSIRIGYAQPSGTFGYDDTQISLAVFGA